MREKLRWQNDFEVVETEENLWSVAQSSVGTFYIYREIGATGFLAVHVSLDGNKTALGGDKLISRTRAICQKIVDQSYTYSGVYYEKTD